MKTVRTLSAIAAAAILSTTAFAAAPTHAPKPHISMVRAKAMALHLAPGKVISSEYEKEDGVWRWSFDIQQKNNVQEIGIDARTGKVVENKSEGRHDQD